MTAPTWRLGQGIEFELPSNPRLMAILNVTPDSFSDGGQFVDPSRALAHALMAVEQGATIIDVGGESTRPGAVSVDAEEQQRRVCPVIRALRGKCDVPISIDTTIAAVAEAALDAGASIVNDTSAGLDDPRMLPLVAARGCGVVLMHRRRTPAQEVRSDRISAGSNDAASHDDVVERVCRALRERMKAAIDAGIAPAQIVLDPGLGFGKTVDENFALLRRLREFEVLGRPLLIGASRKSFIGHAARIERPEDRLAGSLAAAVLAAERGAAILRVHDVGPHREAMAVAAWSGNCDHDHAPGAPIVATKVRATISTPFRDSGELPWPAHPR